MHKLYSKNLSRHNWQDGSPGTAPNNTTLKAWVTRQLPGLSRALNEDDLERTSALCSLMSLLCSPSRSFHSDRRLPPNRRRQPSARDFSSLNSKLIPSLCVIRHRRKIFDFIEVSDCFRKSPEGFSFSFRLRNIRLRQVYKEFRYLITH